MPRPAGPVLSRPVWICRSCLTRPKAGISPPSRWVICGPVLTWRPRNREITAQNVVAVLPPQGGNDPILRGRVCSFSTAHHDHPWCRGCCERGFHSTTEAPRYTPVAWGGHAGNGAKGSKTIQPPDSNAPLLFTAVGAEESGLLGAKYFVQ